MCVVAENRLIFDRNTADFRAFFGHARRADARADHPVEPSPPPGPRTYPPPRVRSGRPPPPIRVPYAFGLPPPPLCAYVLVARTLIDTLDRPF